MSLYAISLQPLITRLQVKSATSQCWYVDVHGAFRKFGEAHRNYAVELLNKKKRLSAWSISAVKRRSLLKSVDKY